MKRYDLVTNYRCGSAIEEMEPAEEGEWVRYEDVVKGFNLDCDCDGGEQGDGLVALPHARTCPVFVRQNCDCVASGNVNKPKQHGADPHAKNCRVYTVMAHDRDPKSRKETN